MGPGRETISADVDGAVESHDDPEPSLFLVFECDRPEVGPARYLLAGVRTVTVGRGPSRLAQFEEIGGARRLSISVPDPRISSVHLHIRRAGGGWELTDAGAKNGTLVNGTKVEARLLADRDLIEVGRTFFLFRRAVAGWYGRPAVMDAAAVDLSIPGLATLVPALESEFARLRAVAAGNLSIAIHGESGTGKELLAAAVHTLSGRRGPFLALNCGALPANLVASELFGYKKGAFSGAEEDRPGLFRSAEQGTLLLDEIGELPPESQAMLLRVLQEGAVLPLGATRPVKVDVRVICATSRDLGALAAQGRFRRDLHDRLAGYTAVLPALRDRVEDFGLIVMVLLRKLADNRGGPVAFTTDAARALLQYEWPGNVRELENCLHAALLLAGRERIALSHLAVGPRVAVEVAQGEPRAARPRLTDEQLRQRESLVELLTTNGGNVSAVARQLGKDRVQIQRWLKRLELDAKTFRR
jgi:transcriptional regulator with AAA-type ATPase domain